MRRLNLDQLQTLVAVADLGTLAAAAQALHLSPPAVSLHIQELEARLDTPLLVRGKRQAQLTDRKSTRLNSSHLVISYAVFCLKKKKTRSPRTFRLTSSTCNSIETSPGASPT